MFVPEKLVRGKLPVVFVAFLIATAMNFPGSAFSQGKGSQRAETNEQGALLYAANFNNDKNGTLPPGWWVEGGQSVYVENGHLRVNANSKEMKGPGYVATVWLNKEFSGNIQVSFDARVIASNGEANNINFFLYYTHPGKDSTLYGTRNLRLDGLYKHYHNLNGYIFTDVNDTFVNPANPKKNMARFRMRRCPGFELIDQKVAYNSLVGKTYHVTITKRGKDLTFAVDGTVYLHATDNRYNWTQGYLGFRTFQSDVWFDNLTVRRLP